MSDPTSGTDSGQTPERPPDPALGRTPWIGYTGWLLAAVGFFYAWVLRVSPSVMVGELMAEFQIGGAILGVLSSLYFYLYAAIQVPVGLALDRWGARWVLTLAMLVTAAGCVLSGWAPAIEWVYAGRLMIGFGAAFSLVGGMVLGAAWFPPRRFAMLSGMAIASGLIGGAVGQYLLAAMMPEIGWRGAMYVIGAAGVALAALTFLFTRSVPVNPILGVPPRAPPVPEGRGVFRTVLRVARHRQVIAGSMVTALASTPILSFGALWGVAYGQVAYGIPKADAAFYVSFMLYGVALGGPTWGWLSDRIGRRKPPLVIGLTLYTAAVAAMLYLPGLPVVAFGALILLAGFGGVSMNLCYAVARESLPARNIGVALGVVNMFAVALGGIVFQPVIGQLLDMQWTGEMVAGARIYSLEAYRWALALLPAAALAALASAVLLIRETHCQPVAE